MCCRSRERPSYLTCTQMRTQKVSLAFFFKRAETKTQSDQPPIEGRQRRNALGLVTEYGKIQPERSLESKKTLDHFLVVRIHAKQMPSSKMLIHGALRIRLKASHLALTYQSLNKTRKFHSFCWIKARSTHTLPDGDNPERQLCRHIDFESSRRNRRSRSTTFKNQRRPDATITSKSDRCGNVPERSDSRTKFRHKKAQASQAENF